MVEGEPRVDGAMPAGAAVVSTRVWRFRRQLQVTVVAKATFAFAPEAPMIRVGPREIFRAEVHHANSPGRSVRFSSDLALYLPRAEVFFTGHGYAPSGEIAPVRLGIFDGARPVFDKSVLIRPSGGVLEVSLVYEHAYGGVGWVDNVVGTGVGEGSREPTVVDPVDPRRLAGFGPIGQYWPARRKLLGALKAKALQQPIAELPDDFDWSYFQAAPPDQRIDFLRGDEWIVMDGLHPSLSRLRTRLPGARGLARVHGLAAFGIAEGQPLALHADTLRIDGDEQQCSLTFRGTFPVPSEAAVSALQVVAGVEIAGEPIAWVAPAAAPGAAPQRPSQWTIDADMPSLDGTLMLEEDADEAPPAKPRLPARSEPKTPPAVKRASPPPLKRRLPEPHPLPVAADDGPLLGRTMAVEGERPRRQTLPFQTAIAGSSALARPSAPSAPPRARSHWDTLAEEPDEEVRAAQRAVLPFGQKTPAVRIPPPMSAEVEEETLEIAPRASPARPAPPPPMAEKVVEAEKSRGSPWAPAPPPAPASPAPKAPPPPPAQPAASAALKKGLYGKFGNRR